MELELGDEVVITAQWFFLYLWRGRLDIVCHPTEVDVVKSGRISSNHQ